MTDQSLPSIHANDVQGFCPACGHGVLMLGDGGHVTCTLIDCPNPSAADELLRHAHLTECEHAAGQRQAETRLRLAHQARRAKEHQLDGIRRALCDVGVIQDDDPYSHADLEDAIRQAFQPPVPAPAAAIQATERSDVGTEFVQQLDHPDEAALTKVEVDLAENGVDTPGCDCGHNGMGAKWHASDCGWKPIPPLDHRRALQRVLWLIAHHPDRIATEPALVLRAIDADSEAYGWCPPGCAADCQADPVVMAQHTHLHWPKGESK